MPIGKRSESLQLDLLYKAYAEREAILVGLRQRYQRILDEIGEATDEVDVIAAQIKQLLIPLYEQRPKGVYTLYSTSHTAIVVTSKQGRSIAVSDLRQLLQRTPELLSKVIHEKVVLGAIDALVAEGTIDGKAIDAITFFQSATPAVSFRQPETEGDK